MMYDDLPMKDSDVHTYVNLHFHETHEEYKPIRSETYHVHIMNYVLRIYIYIYLIGGLEHVLFFHTLGIIIPTDYIIFLQRGWNHQPGVYIYIGSVFF